MGVLFGRRIESHGLTVHMYRVLAALSERADQRLGEVSAMTGIDLSTLSRMIGSMTRMGLVSRVRLTSDERTVQINLTEKGASLAVTLIGEAQHYEDVAIGGLSGAAIKNLKAELVRIYDALDLLEDELVDPTLRRAKKTSPRSKSQSPRLRQNGMKGIPR